VSAFGTKQTFGIANNKAIKQLTISILNRELNYCIMSLPTSSFRRTVFLVAILNLAYFGVEFVVALNISSVSLFADSIDFLQDAIVSLLILVALGWNAHKQSHVGMLLAGFLLIPGIATLWMAWNKIGVPIPPDPILLSLTGIGALAVNVLCAFILTSFRNNQSSFTKMAYLSARNDAVGNIAIIAAGIVTAVMTSAWPDIVVGLGIFAMNLGAAREVFLTAKKEHADAKS
jgi:Co/Zn/Cd efflux system component